MSIKSYIKQVRAKFNPFTITAHWDVESMQWVISAQKHENGDEHALAADRALGGAFKKAAARKIGRSWLEDDGN